MRLLSIALTSAGYYSVALAPDDDGEPVVTEVDMLGSELLALVAPHIIVPTADAFTDAHAAELAELRAGFEKTLTKVYEGPNGRGEEQIALQNAMFPLIGRERRARAVAALVKVKADDAPTPADDAAALQKAKDDAEAAKARAAAEADLAAAKAAYEAALAKVKGG